MAQGLDTGISIRGGHPSASLVTRVLDTILLWRERQRQRRALEALPDHLLSDIGVSRLDATYEAEKPFWRG